MGGTTPPEVTNGTIVYMFMTFLAIGVIWGLKWTGGFNKDDAQYVNYSLTTYNLCCWDMLWIYCVATVILYYAFLGFVSMFAWSNINCETQLSLLSFNNPSALCIHQNRNCGGDTNWLLRMAAVALRLDASMASFDHARMERGRVNSESG